MKLGFSIYADILLTQNLSDRDSQWQASFETSSEILELLKENGFTSIEVKLPANWSLSKLKHVLQKISSYGFSFSFHAPGSLRYPEGMIRFTRYITDIATLVNATFGQTTNFVIHGLSCYHISKQKTMAFTIDFLRELLAATSALDIDFAVELLRDVPLNGKVRGGTSFSEILEIVNAVKSQRLGICWDFGHSFFQSERGVQPALPPVEFLHKIFRTHIHDYANNVTHLPLGHGKIPFEDYLGILITSGFSGILNLELNPTRIMDPENFKTYILESADYLKNIVSALEINPASINQGIS